MGMFVCVHAYFPVRAADNSTLSSYMVHVKIIMSNTDLICLVEKQKSDCKWFELKPFCLYDIFLRGDS